jgi:RNA polymerase sigma factor (sigma-70 family)
MPSTKIRGWRVLGRTPGPTGADGELLDRFAGAADGDAFAELLRRHGPWVLGLCRRIAGDPHDAEDAFQATFLVLVRRAGTVRNRASVASWLHGVAFKVAARARGRARPAADPADRPAPGPDPAVAAAGREEARILHEEVARLPAVYREAVLLCDLAGLSRDEAAERLGCPPGAVKGRLERGRAALRDRLARRGVAAAPAVAAVPAALAESTAQAAAGMVVTGLAAVPAPVATLVAATTRPTLAPALTTLAVLLAGVAGFGYGLGPPAPPDARATSPRTLPTAAPVPAADNRPAQDALKRAAEELDKVEDEPIARTRLWCAIADLHRKLGDATAARDALDRARAAAVTPEGPMYAEWRGIGEAYARLGDDRTVLDLAAAVPAAAIKNGYPQDTILQESAWAAAETGHARAAERIAGALPDGEMKDWVKAEMRQRLAVHKARSGDTAGALRAVDGLPTAEEKVFALVGPDVLNLGYDDHFSPYEDGIAHAQLAAGDRAGAKASAMKAFALIPAVKEDHRGRVAVSVARVLAKLDDLPAARKAMTYVPAGPDPKLAKRSPDFRHGWDLKGMAYLAAAEVRAGRDDAAAKIADGFKLAGEKAHVLQFVALAQARAGRKDASKATFARAIELSATSGGVGARQHNIASAQALAGDFDGAMQTAEKAGGLAISNVAGFLALAGRYGEARKLAAEKVEGRMWKAQDSLYVAKLQTKAGRADAARAWIKEEGDRLLKAYALVGLAEGLLREDRPKAAK